MPHLAGRAAGGARIPLWPYWIAVVASVTALAVAIIGAGEGPTLRPMSASESMPDEQAIAVAANTARLWLRERDAGHVANFEALTCRGALRGDLEHTKRHDAVHKEISAVGRLTRAGSVWKLDTGFTSNSGTTWVFHIEDGGLQVCGFEVPSGFF